jgi:23S rRNA pseudouridine1911/1915/1917 synthase
MRLLPERRVRLDVAITEAVPDLSRSRAGKLVREGAVTVDGVVVRRPATQVGPPQQVDVEVPPPQPSGVRAQDLPLSVVYQDADLVVVDKAAGMVVHPGAGHPDGTLVNALLHHIGDLSGIGGVERPGIVHRLDRGTSGLLVVAKHDRAHQHLAAQFAAHTARRTYLALCIGRARSEGGTLRSFLARHPKDRVRYASTPDERGREAVTHWRALGQARGTTLIQCELETGRTHQIRVHLSENGLPLAGDPLYRPRKLQTPRWIAQHLQEGRVLLHARRLRFRHPADDGERVYEAPLPPDFAAVLGEAGLDA